MLHLKFKPKILPQIVAFMHIKTHQTGEGPHFVTFLNGFPLQNGEATKNLAFGASPVWMIHKRIAILLLSKNIQGPAKVHLGSHDLGLIVV